VNPESTLGRRFFISWIVSALVMFGASYFWHGVILTDFERMAYPKGIFLLVASVVYLLVSLGINKVYELKVLSDKFPKMVIVKGMIAGAIVGLLMYMVTMVVGVSFSNNMSLANMLLDVSWQTVEGTIGGIAVGIVHLFVFDERAFRAD